MIRNDWQCLLSNPAPAPFEKGLNVICSNESNSAQLKQRGGRTGNQWTWGRAESPGFGMRQKQSRWGRRHPEPRENTSSRDRAQKRPTGPLLGPKATLRKRDIFVSQVSPYNIHTYNILLIYIYIIFNKFIDKFITCKTLKVTANFHLQLHASIFLYIS